MTTLLLDVGNSRLKWGLLVNDRIDTTGSVELAELARQGPLFLREQLPQDFNAAIACNVAGEKIAADLSTLGEIEFVSSTQAAFGVTNSYRETQALGDDRWVAMIGARALTDSACLVVDAGTAVTLDALDPAGRHLGGQILPGFRLMAGALGDATSDLPQVDTSRLQGRSAGPYFGTSTHDAISFGIAGAVVGAIERSLQALRASHEDTVLLLTGGDAAAVQSHLAEEATLRPNLVLEGLAVVFRRQSRG